MAAKKEVESKALNLIHAGTDKFQINPPFTEREGQILKAFYCVALEAVRLSDRCKGLDRELTELNAKRGSVNE